MMGLSPQQAAAIEAQEREAIPLNRHGKPDDVARWNLLLAEPASGWITGQVITADGGLGRDRKSVVEGQSVSVRVDLGGRRIIKKKTDTQHTRDYSATHTILDEYL